MKATVIDRYGPPDVLELADIDRPSVGEGEVLVRIVAASAQAGDWHLVRGEPYFIRLMFGLRKPKSRVTGQDVAGRVEAVGPNVTGLEPGDYLFPHTGGGTEAMRSEEFQNKVKEGPIGIMTIMPASAWLNMGPQLSQWFAYTIVVSVITAYIGGRTLAPGADYLAVFQITGTVAFAAYAMAVPQRSIWWHQNWGTTMRSMIDGLVYASVTAGAFGWLWPS